MGFNSRVWKKYLSHLYIEGKRRKMKVQTMLVVASRGWNEQQSTQLHHLCLTFTPLSFIIKRTFFNHESTVYILVQKFQGTCPNSQQKVSFVEVAVQICYTYITVAAEGSVHTANADPPIWTMQNFGKSELSSSSKQDITRCLLWILSWTPVTRKYGLWWLFYKQHR